MTSTNFNQLNLDELREYVLTHREDTRAFHAYIDRSKADGRMIVVNLQDDKWEKHIENAINSKQ